MLTCYHTRTGLSSTMRNALVTNCNMSESEANDEESVANLQEMVEFVPEWDNDISNGMDDSWTTTVHFRFDQFSVLTKPV